MESKFQLAPPTLHRRQLRLPWTIVEFSIIFVTLCSLPPGLMGECPRLCECKWKSGKESVLCLNANLSNIPTRLDGGTQVLDLTGNDISNIPHDAFASANLLNLQKVFLAKCRLRAIERFAFRKLNNLVELDLSYNLLTMIPSHAFDSVPELREIKLNGNPIQRIVNDAFLRVPHLIRLELSDCKINNLELRAFAGLEASLEWLKLDGNKLVEIRSDILTNFKNLHGLELARNPWNCSCNLRPLRAWMLRENVPYGVPPVCKTPGRLGGKSWEKIDLDEFACVPQIMAPDTKAHGVEGKNITMSCYVEGVPEPNVRWIVKNRVIANLTGEAILPATQGRKMYMVNLQKNSSNLTILTADVQDAGTYICAAENKAGRVEASVTLAVSRKPPEAALGAKVILLCVLIALLMVVMSSLGALCVCSLRKKRKTPRWNTPARSDSYEKIEMSRKPNMRPFRADENGYIRPHIENGIAIVNPTKKNGDYRNVPTDDDDTGYEDNSEGTGCSGFNKKESGAKMKPMISAKSPAETKLNIDLHIPSSNPESASSSVSSQVDAAARLAEATGGSTANYLQQKTSWSNQFLGKKSQVLPSIDHNSAAEAKGVYCPPRTIETEFCDSERKYPDLLDVTSFSAANTTAFCTLPRKMKAVNKYFKNSSDSQSPLLPESSSKYSSSTLGESSLPGDISSRRFSAESYNNYILGKPAKLKLAQNQQRSNSFLNLVTTPGQATSQRRNPSLPSSPVRESHQRSLSSAATPLLDFSSLASRSGMMPATPSTSNTMNAYDYHAAQLERFLEEYRNLQEQLCKMKETCESIRKKEAPLRAALSHSAAQYADPVMFNAASNSVVVEPPNPKIILKNKSILPGQPPDPPPYWLHRNAMLKRLNDSQSEFFQS
ncbi:uncharacterized protein LOC119646566 isoform X2 [Hermetia illucens]|uniref:uncharacterized protein LOC119646566 isoform X2 n=1 Tax=Hermetia illucens TaxID=343691 RepID=UPI0018CC50BD|nr:uncharacterized protein LOC119646566 isoform X2 [Hermetia illucens]